MLIGNVGCVCVFSIIFVYHKEQQYPVLFIHGMSHSFIEMGMYVLHLTEEHLEDFVGIKMGPE